MEGLVGGDLPLEVGFKVLKDLKVAGTAIFIATAM